MGRKDEIFVSSITAGFVLFISCAVKATLLEWVHGKQQRAEIPFGYARHGGMSSHGPTMSARGLI